MPSFAYQIRDASGHSRVGVLEADTLDAAMHELRRPGRTVVDIHPTDAAGRAEAHVRGGRIKRDHVIFFANQLAVMVETGVTLSESLDAIAEQTEHLTLKQVIRDLSEQVKAGTEFSTALARHPKVFSAVFIALMRASEASGRMAEMLYRVSQYLTQERDTRKRVKGAMTYPLCMMGFCVAVVVGMLLFILPRFEKIYAGKGAVLPAPTRVLLAMSHTLVHQWYYVVGTVVAVTVFAVSYFRTPEGRTALARLRIRMPLLGGMFRKAYLARSLRTLGAMVSSGVSVLDGLEITAQASGNEVYAKFWRGCAEQVQEGTTISECLYSSALIPRTIVQMLEAGERTGQLGKVMDRVAQFCEDDLKLAVKTATQMIEPVMIIVMGAIIGGIAMALLLPIFSLSKVIAH